MMTEALTRKIESQAERDDECVQFIHEQNSPAGVEEASDSRRELTVSQVSVSRHDATPAPLLILLPGLDGTGKLFAEFLREVEGRLATRVIAYPKDVPLGYRELETRVREVWPKHRPCVLLGDSFSGPIAIRMAADPPPNLAKLILCATFSKNPYPYARWARGLVQHLPVKSLPRWLRAPLMWGSIQTSRAPRQAERGMAGVSVPVIRRRIAELLDVDATAELNRVRLPILILQAASDRVIPASATRWMARHRADAHWVRIDGPHLLLQARPRECARAIEDFMREPDPAAEGRTAHGLPGG